MNLKKSFPFLFLVVASLIAVDSLCAQDPVRRIPNPSSRRESNVKGNFYRLDLSMREMEDGKTISTRNYSLWMRANGEPGILRISHDAPITSRSIIEEPTSPPKKQAIFVEKKSISVDLTCFLKETDSDLELNVNGEIKGIIPPEKGMEYPPVYRHITLVSTALLTPGKPATISSVDDPGSNRQFQIDATATKTK